MKKIPRARANTAGKPVFPWTGILFGKVICERKNYKLFVMEKSFTIVFDFPLEHSSMTLHLTATAQLHHSTPYYVVDAFHLQNAETGMDSLSILPSVEIERRMEDGKETWIHRDSGRSSLLSLALGKAIEEQSPDEVE